MILHLGSIPSAARYVTYKMLHFCKNEILLAGNNVEHGACEAKIVPIRFAKEKGALLFYDRKEMVRETLCVAVFMGASVV